jgi:hypothetical protein
MRLVVTLSLRPDGSDDALPQDNEHPIAPITTIRLDAMKDEAPFLAAGSASGGFFKP